MISLHFSKCFPRQCGGQPFRHAEHHRQGSVFPASAGVNPVAFRRKTGLRCFPRQCGGQPPLHLHDGDLLPFSPPVRGSTCGTPLGASMTIVFPAGAGVNPRALLGVLPH